ncbi:unnamed protein product [Schistosoma margrebowiei]|uniref:Uncharacterized protein n=1 Tax=Schistosoma margrebowiei TaxID=48269 RepID=A0A183MKW2_9TREM|nr:unnamed protein product [Schistosoma margrebowiei]
MEEARSSNTTRRTPTPTTTVDGETLEQVESFMYLNSMIDEPGGSDEDVKARIEKSQCIGDNNNNHNDNNNNKEP